MNVGTLKAGSLPWLLHHEFRIWWRRMTENKSTVTLWSIVGGLALLMLGCTASLLFAFRLFASRSHMTLTATGISDTAIWIAVGVWIFSFVMTLPSVISQSALILFDRGDFDLLLSSPISTKVVLASRLLQLALGVFVGGCIWAVPMTLVAVPLGYLQLLGVYPSLIGLSLSVASIAILLTLWLVQWLGVQRTKTVIQTATVLSSGVLYLSFQTPNLLRGTPWQSVSSQPLWHSWFSANGLFSAKSWIWFPARAALGDVPAIILTLVVSGSLAWFTVKQMHLAFLNGTQQTPIAKSSQGSATSVSPFTGNLTLIVLLKEWRTIARNPVFLTRVAYQVFMLVPLLVMLNRWIGNMTTVVAVLAPIIGGGLVMTLTQVCVSAEEGPSLLRSSPIEPIMMCRLKLMAVLTPIWGLAAPVFLLLMFKDGQWLLALIPFLGVTICSAILGLWSYSPTPINKIFEMRQHSQSGSLLLACIQPIQLLVCTAVGFLLGQGLWLGSLFCLVIVGVLMTIAYVRSRVLGTLLGF
jgi:ABC-2 type transport system permease protein